MAGRRRRRRGRLSGPAAVLIALSLTACAAIPADPDGTLDRVTDGMLRVGVSTSPGLVQRERTAASGPLADLVEEFADALDADVRWSFGGEEDLVAGLERGELDLAVGGMTEATPWVDRVGVTRGYPDIAGAEGRAIVMFVPLGENAMLSELETFLDEEVGP